MMSHLEKRNVQPISDPSRREFLAATGAAVAAADHVVFGSGTPLHDIEPIVGKMQQAKLTDGNRQEVAKKNADRLVATAWER